MAGVSSSIRVLLGKLESALRSEFADQHKKSALHLEKLCATFSSIGVLFTDLEGKQLEGSMKVWIEKLEDVVYNTDDLVDEILYDDARAKVEAKSQKPATFARKLFPSFGKQYGKGMRSKIKDILEATDDLVRDIHRFNFRPAQRIYEESRFSSQLNSTSLVDKTDVVGRDEDKQRIVNLLLSGDADLDGIAIAGMGGCGKTTLAQLVYNDSKVEKYFDPKVWIYVSEHFDIRRITRQILESIAGVNIPERYDLNMLHIRLRESLEGKRFLLVLDDVWNGDIQKWENLKVPLIYGAKGSRILITTRNKGVATVMGCSTSYMLDMLSEKDCWDIFRSIALSDMTQNVPTVIEDIGKEIVKRCDGLPLAVKVIGGSLRSIRNLEVWRQVLESDIFQSEAHYSRVLPVLRLSYFHLPDHLKLCFVYCSLFPLDCEFEAEKLIHLWMAEGFLLQFGNPSMEKVGAEYFDRLLEMSFFQLPGGSYFQMHDLIHDLASSVAGEVFCRLERNQSVHKRTRHLSLLTGQYDSPEELQGIHEAKSLRTFLNHGSCPLGPGALEDMLARQRGLRVLSLPQFQNAQLPHSIGKLKVETSTLPGPHSKCIDSFA